jgi:Carbohydrate-binding module 48 (Isoamylase N-terminal domain)
LLSLASAALPRAEAQFAERQRTPNDAFKSTEVSADHKVTFRIFAPKASEVSVGGDFGEGGKLTKDEQGIWSITVGPIVPDFYSYTFNVDGVRTVDPKNAMVKQGIAGVDSMFLVPGNEADFEATREVPHGEIRSAWHHSGAVDKKLPLADFGVFCKVRSPGIRQGKSESGHFFETAPRSDRAILGMRYSFPPSTFLSRSVEPRS